MSKKVRGKEDIIYVVLILVGDEEIGKFVVDVMEKVINDGVIIVEELKIIEIIFEIVEGMQFDRGYIFVYMVIDIERMEVVFDDLYILIIDKKILIIQDILLFFEQIVQQGRKFLIIVEDVEGEVLVMFVVNKFRGIFQCVVVKVLGFGDRRKVMFQDIVIFIGGQVIFEEFGFDLREVKFSQFGCVRQVKVQKENIIIVDGVGDLSEIKVRIQFIKKQIEEIIFDFDREKF